MNVIHHSEVLVPENRQRREFDEHELRELAEDMAKPHGQLHAIVLRADRKTLVAGERRLRAARLGQTLGLTFAFGAERMGPGHLAYTVLSELTGDELEEAELSENVHRKDLTWQEIVDARARLAKLRKKQDPTTTNLEVAAEIAGHPVTSGREVADAVLLAENMHRPGVKRAESARAAMKVLNKELEQEFRAEIVRRQESKSSDIRHTLIHGDLHEELVRIPAGLVDCIVTDPPYGISANSAFGDMASLEHDYIDDPDVALAIYERIALEGFRVTKDEAHAYVFVDFDWWDIVSNVFTDVGWDVWKRPLVWDKGGGMAPHPNHGPRYSCEYILFANKGKRPCTSLYNDVLRYPLLKDKQHAAQKPVDVYVDLIKRTCAPGEVVLDPCCGSGTVFPAANKTGTIALGMEKLRNHYEAAFVRLKE